jgi:hypothetical protein
MKSHIARNPGNTEQEPGFELMLEGFSRIGAKKSDNFPGGSLPVAAENSSPQRATGKAPRKRYPKSERDSRLICPAAEPRYGQRLQRLHGLVRNRTDELV